jgi:two-component system LytT family response regulator
MKISVVIADDEPLARERLRELLRREPNIEIVAEAENGHAALEAIAEHKPQLVFLDVQMPELTGFEVVEHLSDGPMPAIVFVTAYDQFAVKAFEVHAVDYVLKPVDADRLKTALQRALDRIRSEQTEDLNSRVQSLLAEIRPEPKQMERIAVKNGNRVILLKVEDIDWVEAADNYVVLHSGNDNHMQRSTISAMEEKLPPDKFVRISRSAIVNVDRIKELQPLFHGEYVVILRNGTRLTLSRTHRDKLGRLGIA